MPALSYENKDTTPINAEKEQYLKFYNKYVNAGMFLATSISVLEYYEAHKTDIEIIQKFSPNFFNITTYSLWAQSVIICSAFFNNKDDMCFYEFFKYISENFEQIFTGDFYTYKLIKGKKVEYEHYIVKQQDLVKAIRECKNLIKQNKQILSKIKDYRNVLYAHFSEGVDSLLNKSTLK
ncbi:MAG: hypothetical protein IJQ66_02135, partial [Clostridia bacterium]|nr:hypothetical protein [Clostridia bacterium]